MIENEHKIPILKKVLNLVNKNINIELKSFDTSEKIVALIEDYITNKNWSYTDFLVSSFDWNALQNLRFLNE